MALLNSGIALNEAELFRQVGVNVNPPKRGTTYMKVAIYPSRATICRII
jgi:hypothetical protein